MKHPHLPQYFAIKRDENSPLWEEYIEWLNSFSDNPHFWGGQSNNYYGFDGNKYLGCGGTDHWEDPKYFINPVTIITLEEWKQAIDKTEDMKETERGRGDRKEAMASAYDNIRQNMEHSNSTRGKGVSTSAKNAQVEFDPEKPYEISFNFPDDEQVEWETGYHFIGFKKNGNIIVEREDGRLRAVAQIRNIFHAGMLKRGEFMIDEQGDIYTYVYSGCASSMNLRTNQTYGDLEGSKIRGKRVKLNITPEEI